MSINKGAIIRYHTLDRCLRNPGRRYYVEDLLEECNKSLQDFYGDSTTIQKRQLLKDLNFMEDSSGYNAPIERISDGNRRKYYRYRDLSFSIMNHSLSLEEIEKFKLALNTLTRFQGLPQFEWIDELSSRLSQEFQLNSDQKIIAFEENPYIRGRAFLWDLYNYITNRQVIQIIYRPFTKAEQEHILHPYYLRQYNNRWFLFGWNEQFQRLSNFAIDRIIRIQTLNIAYKPNTICDFDTYFDDFIGVTMPSDTRLEKVLLRIDASLWPYIQTKPLHGSQRIKQRTDEFILIEIEVHINYELKSLILSYGERMEVIEPQSLREEISDVISALQKKYFRNAH